jgi:hypothetical protein
MEEMSKLGWLIGLVKHATSADSFCLLYLRLLAISKILASSQPTHDPLHRHVGLIVIYLEDPVGGRARVHGAARLEVCLFRQCSFCHIHMEYC